MKIFLSHSEAETLQIASEIGAGLVLPAMICLFGDLGTGKTVFAKGLAESLGIPARQIKSPTFTVQRRHKKGMKKLYHFDFYRVRESDELIRRDLEEALSDPYGLVVAEWAENIADCLPQNRFEVRCRYINETSREYKIIKFPR